MLMVAAEMDSPVKISEAKAEEMRFAIQKRLNEDAVELDLKVNYIEVMKAKGN